MFIKVWIEKPLMLVLYPWFVLGCIFVQLIPYWYNGILLHVIPIFVFIYRITSNRFIFNRHRPPFYQPNQCWSLRCFHGKNSYGTEFFTVVNVSFLFYSKTVKVSSFVFPPFINTTLYSFIFLVQHNSTFPWCYDTDTYFLSCKKFCNKVT